MDDTALTPHAGYLEEIAREARRIEWGRSKCEERADVARSVDALLVRVARGRGALDIAIGERLDAVRTRGHAARLGFSTDGEYVRERFGDAPSSAQKLRRFSRALRERPLLCAAVRAGHVTRRQAEAVLAVASGPDEAFWVERARTSTVRDLQQSVKEPLSEEEEDEGWKLFSADIPLEYRAAVHEVMTLKDPPFTAATLRSDRVVAVCQETLGELAAWSDVPCDGETMAVDAAPLEKWLEETTAQWAFLERPENVSAPGPIADFEADARQLDAELRHHYGMRDQWDEHLGHLAMIFRSIQGWVVLGFLSFEHYCAERLGMHPKTVRQRAGLERDLSQLPSLRDAMRSGVVSYEKARLIARFAPELADKWISRAQRISCADLRRELQGEEDGKMCARGSFRVFLPRQTHLLLQEACRAVRKAAGQWFSPGECFGKMCARFMEVWRQPKRRSTRQQKVRDRDEGLCRVPGCSRAGQHDHHIDFRSRGGGDELSNQVLVCAAHHRAIHN
ncbi:MAG TPA: HNH endonuclease signature motif containing protein, partial [Myxococcales bacterium]|nr:HNH endonuclease signature motif containing protein [Myxococcales bacterium]